MNTQTKKLGKLVLLSAIVISFFSISAIPVKAAATSTSNDDANQAATMFLDSQSQGAALAGAVNAQDQANAAAVAAKTGVSAQAALQQVSQQAPAASTSTGGGSCSLFNPFTADCLTGLLASVIYFALTIVAYFLGLIGIIFNWAIVITVFQYGLYFGNSQGMLLAWGILRDMGNIVVLFAFIYLGIMMILDLQSYDARKALPRLLIFAVLLNFSLFVGEAVVDVSNVLAAELYKVSGITSTSSLNSASGTIGASSATGSSVAGTGTNNGIAGLIMQDTGVGGVFSSKAIGDNGKQILVFSGIILFMAVVMMVLVAGAIVLFTRAIMLTLLLVLSPLAFAGMAVPQLEGQAKEWWHRLISNAFFAPIYLLLIFVGLKVMEASRNAFGSTNLITALTSPGSTVNTAGIFIIFAMVVGFMYGAFMFAKSSSTVGATFATSFAQKRIKQAFMAPARLAAIPIRKGVGAGANKFGTSYDQWMGRARVSDNKVDKAFAWTMRKTGVDAGVKGALGAAQTTTYGGLTRSYQESEKAKLARTKSLQHAKHDADTDDLITAGIKAQKDLSDAKDGKKVLSKKQEADAAAVIETAAQAVSQLNKKDLEARFNKNINNDSYANAMATLLTAGQAADVLGNDEIGSQVKHDIVSARYGEAHELRAAYEVTDTAAKTATEAAEVAAAAAKAAPPALKAAADAASKAAEAAKATANTKNDEAFKKLADHLGEMTDKDAENIVKFDNSFAMTTFALMSPDGKGRGVLGNDVRNGLAKNSSLTKSQRKYIKSGDKAELLKRLVRENNEAAIKTLIEEGRIKKEAAEVSQDDMFKGGTLTTGGKAFARALDVDRMRAMAVKGEMDGDFKKALLKVRNSVPDQEERNPNAKIEINQYLSKAGGSSWGVRNLDAA